MEEIRHLKKPEIVDEEYEYLELGKMPKEIINPFIDIPQSGDIVEDVMSILTSKDYIHFASKSILNIDLLPYQLVVLDTLWNRRLPMLIATRGAGKSFMLAVYALLRMIFNPGCRVVIVGAAFRQARQVFEYMTDIWNKAPILQEIAGDGRTAGPRREIDRCQFTIGDSHCYAVPLGDGQKIRGLRANYILGDEIASIPPEIFNLVIRGFAVVSLDPVDKVKKMAVINRLKALGEWTDELEKLRLANATGNQIVYSGTAYFSFNHFYQTFEKWRQIISSKGDPKKLKHILIEGDVEDEKGFNWRDYAVLRIPYTAIPEGALDAGILAQGKATLNRAQFLMEFGAVFATDTDGFYKRSIVESATTHKPIVTSGGQMVQFSALMHGDKEKVYAIGIDPAADADNAAVVVLELNTDHRKVVHCWTTNKRKHNELRKISEKSGIILEDNYYKYIATKVKELMGRFNTEHIIMDKNGGGTAVAEALAEGDLPIYTIIDIEKPHYNDNKKGLHILELLAPTADINSEANHGMLKDLQEKVLLFPMFDTIELAKAAKFDQVDDILFDGYEALVEDIEELKNEMTSIVVKPSSTLGKETFDTPSVKSEGARKGHLRKDRFSALLYANYYGRNRGKADAFQINYVPVGGIRNNRIIASGDDGSMYTGPGMRMFAGKDTSWNNSSNVKFRLRR